MSEENKDQPSPQTFETVPLSETWRPEPNTVRGERIGFVLKGDSKIKWADQCIDRNDIDLDVDPDVSVFDAAELLAELALHKSSLLS